MEALRLNINIEKEPRSHAAVAHICYS